MKFVGDLSVLPSSSPSAHFAWHFSLDQFPTTVVCGEIVAILSFEQGLGRGLYMEKGYHGRCVFPLTGLQIGDLQSYLSDLSLFLAPESKKFYILVDNRPWLQDLVSRPAHLWQLMVTKSRLSPFANTRGRKAKDTEYPSELKASSKLTISGSQKLKRWFSLVDAATLSKKRALLPVKKLRSSLIINSKLHRTLHGFIVFEVAWTDVRGINYLNELQTDSSLAIETKFMRRWEFDSIAQAVGCMSSWFPGTPSERFLLQDHLNSAIGEVFYDASENFLNGSSISENDGVFNINVCEGESPYYLSNSLSIYPHTPPPEGPYKRRKLTSSMCTDAEADMFDDDMCDEGAYSGSIGSPVQSSQTSDASDSEDSTEATHYRDVLLLFRFDDRDLPFKLKGIIMSDLRLLTLLEYGLPSWVLFLQSYPVFCHLYRPWMCPLARALYVFISLVTVLIGFYDLYKNVPVLKATASRLCGPLFDWIETWEMVSRIKYLGTMLFLHNFEKAVTWFLMVTRTTRSFLSVMTQPISGPFVELLELLLPVWNFPIQIVEGFGSFAWVLIEGSWNLVDDLVEIIIQPVWFIVTLIRSIATSIIYPICWCLSEILYAPIRLVLGICTLVSFICTCIYELIGGLWLFISSLVQFASNAEETVSSYEVSLWRSLWNDLFSQIFRAVRSILHGFVAFFTACNRHRLSIYNHSSEIIERLYRQAHRSKIRNSVQEGQPTGIQTLSEGWEENPLKIRDGKQKYL